VTRITDSVIERMAEWQNRPLDVVYPVMFIDAIHVKIREGQVTNRPIYVPWGSPSTVSVTSSGCGPAKAARVLERSHVRVGGKGLRLGLFGCSRVRALRGNSTYC